MLLVAFDFFENIRKWNVIVALAVAVTAFVVMCLASRISKKLRPDFDADRRSALTLRIKMFCAIAVFAAALLAVIF